MHMDLNRMRDIPDGWTRASMAMHDKYKPRIKLADQVTCSIEILSSILNQLEKLEAARSVFLLLPLVTFPGLTRPYWALLCFTWPYWALHGLNGPYWALHGLTGTYWI